MTGRFPAVFALPAGWGDVLIGLMTAPIVAWLLWKRHPWSRRLAVLWNVAGIADLVTAVTLGVLSAPGSFHRLALETPNAAISAFPFVLIPTVLVPLSILLHVFSLRKRARNDPKCSDSASTPSAVDLGGADSSTSRERHGRCQRLRTNRQPVDFSTVSRRPPSPGELVHSTGTPSPAGSWRHRLLAMGRQGRWQELG